MPPNVLPALLTPSLLTSIRRQPHLPRHTWYFVTAVTLSALNRPDEIARVFQHALENGPGPEDRRPGPDEQLTMARKTREALIKSAAIAGLPKAINALYALKGATPASLRDEPLGYSPTGRSVDVHDVPSSTALHRGQAFFDKIYGKVSKRVMGQMDRSGTEDLGLTARLLYGYILSNTNVLSAAESSFVLLAGLIPQDVNPQLKGHLKGALNNGASLDEVKAVREVAIRVCGASGMKKLDEVAAGGWGWRHEVANL